MKQLLFISEDKERALIQELTYKMKMANMDIHPSNTCFLMVSPDYSAIVTQHLSHSLSVDREIFHIEAVNTPYLDENATDYKTEFTQNFMKWQRRWDNFVLVASDNNTGDTFSWISDIMIRMTGGKIYAVSLCESTNTRFKSDLACLHYDSEQFRLIYWWQQPNNRDILEKVEQRQNNPLPINIF